MTIDATVCPKGHSDCANISEPIMDLMPDQMYQLYYCHECERTYEVMYTPNPPTLLNKDGLQGN